MNIDNLSAVVHGTLRAYNRAVLGDYSEPEWGGLKDDARSEFTRRVSFVVENRYAPPSALHDHWMSGLLLAGWRHGVAYDPNNKMHPRLIPWTKLPAKEQTRDRLFFKIVNTLVGE